MQTLRQFDDLLQLFSVAIAHLPGLDFIANFLVGKV